MSQEIMPDSMGETTPENTPDEPSEVDQVAKSKSRLVTAVIIMAAIILVLAIIVINNLLTRQPGEVAKENKQISIEPNTNASVPDNPAPTAASTPEPKPPVTEPEEEVKKADLYVKKYSFSEDPEVDNKFTVKIDIGNMGKADAEKSRWQWWANDSIKACDKEVDVIQAGGYRSVSCEYTYKDCDDYTTKVVVDADKDINESNENNNQAEKEVTPIHEPEKPDLYISDYYFNHAPKQGEAFKINITIKNKGAVDADSFKWEWWSTWATKACNGEIDDLEAGKSKEVSCEYTYSSWSTYATKAVADADEDIDESDETNNTYTKEVVPIH